jgi:hypothetical protein
LSLLLEKSVFYTLVIRVQVLVLGSAGCVRSLTTFANAAKEEAAAGSRVRVNVGVSG